MTRTRDGRVAVELRRPRPNGATHMVLDGLGLVKKLAALVHPPALHRVRYFGVLSSASQHRKYVVPPLPLLLSLPPIPALEVTPALEFTPSVVPKPKGRRRPSWAAQISRRYGVDPLSCPNCKLGRLRPIAVISPPAIVQKILDHLERHPKPRAAPVAPE